MQGSKDEGQLKKISIIISIQWTVSVLTATEIFPSLLQQKRLICWCEELSLVTHCSKVSKVESIQEKGLPYKTDDVCIAGSETQRELPAMYVLGRSFLESYRCFLA